MTKAELIDAVKGGGPDGLTKKDTAAIVEAVFD
jgi:nucleoid DNA-binding protein